MKRKLQYNHTIYACYIGYITQAIINNFAPLLFLTFRTSFGLSLEQVAFLVTINFGVQLVVDVLSARYADRIGYRTLVMAAHGFAAAGLAGLAVLPGLLPSAYAGIVVSVICYAIGGGLIEVLISPIVEACPTEKKEAAMSLLHSFYCWGHVFVVVCSTVFFMVAGIGQWRILACIWAVIPFANLFYFSRVPIQVLVEEGDGISLRSLCTNGVFWCLFLLMICAGASEQAMSQWASAYAEAGLQVNKTIGDLAGPCSFAILMGTARVLSARMSGRFRMPVILGGSGILCIAGYLTASLTGIPVLGLVGCGICGFSVGTLWPGTFSMAAKALPKGGTAMFALLALGGDIGCSLGPTYVGVVSTAFGENLRIGILCAVVFPVLLLLGLVLYNFAARHKNV